jgi:hypothetical protein
MLNFMIADDIVHFPSKPCARAPTLRPKRHNFINRIIAELAVIPELRCLSRAAGGLLCHFCRRSGGFRLILGQTHAAAEWAGALWPSNQHHAAAIALPQIWIGG